MPKKSEKKRNVDTIRAARLKRTARIVGVSERQVRRVCDGQQENDLVLITMCRIAKMDDGFDSMLIEEVNKLIPFPAPKGMMSKMEQYLEYQKNGGLYCVEQWENTGGYKINRLKETI